MANHNFKNKLNKESFLSRKAKDLAEELGGMDTPHPTRGDWSKEMSDIDLTTMTDEEIKNLIRTGSLNKKESEFDYEGLDSELDEINTTRDNIKGRGNVSGDTQGQKTTITRSNMPTNEEYNEGFDSEEIKRFRNLYGDYNPKSGEFKRMPSSKEADYLSNLETDSMYLPDYMEKFPEDELGDEDDENRFNDDYDDDDGGEFAEGSKLCECGSGLMESDCNECGKSYMEENLEMEEGIYDVASDFDYNPDGSMEFDYVQERDEDYDLQDTTGDDVDFEEQIKMCKRIAKTNPDEFEDRNCDEFVNINEIGMVAEGKKKLHGNQRKLDKNKNGRLDAQDFKMLRAIKGKKHETKEGEKFPDLSGDGKVTRKDVLIGRGVFNKKGKKKVNKGKVKESVKLTESEMIDLIEKIVNEQKRNIKKGGTHKGLTTYEKAHRGSGKENNDYIKSVTKKMKDYLKDGSKGEYSMEPKMFPKGNGELAKMSKKAYIPSDAVQDYTDNLTAAGLENITYDEIHPNEDWVDMNMVGSSKTGNNPEWANSVDTGVNKKRRKVQKDNLLGKIKQKAYNKSPQPIVTDNTGEDAGSKLLMKLESETPKKLENLNEEFDRMKQLFSYNRKTQ